MGIVSWVVWIVWMAFGLGWEIATVALEKSKGTLPVTRVLRERLAKRYVWARLGLLLGLSWLWVHFILNLSW